jgi:uncharacterized peroxidase-related enzyme
MAFIETIPVDEASGAVRDMYERQQAHYGYVPNYAKVFSHRPEIMRLWAELLRGIRRNLDDRRFELVTVAAAVALRSSYCALAHGRALRAFHTDEEIRDIVDGSDAAPLTDAEREMMAFARKVARDASTITAVDVERLARHGLTAADIFDVAATAAARTFFAQLCEGLGALADSVYGELDATLKAALTVGRPIDRRLPEASSSCFRPGV